MDKYSIGAYVSDADDPDPNNDEFGPLIDLLKCKTPQNENILEVSSVTFELFTIQKLLSRTVATSLTMSKRDRSLSASYGHGGSSKKRHVASTFNPPMFATREAADAVHADLPLTKLLTTMREGVKSPKAGACVVYWMRMGDLRGNEEAPWIYVQYPDEP